MSFRSPASTTDCARVSPRALRRARTFAGSIVIALVVAFLFSRFAVHLPAQSAAPIQTVFVIVFENYDWSQIAGSTAAPYINSLLPQSSYALKYSTPPGVHPSTPNYLWMEAGQDFGLAGTTNDSPATSPLTTTAHLVTQLQNAGISWKNYDESIGGTTCPLGDSGSYTVTHNPFVFFNDVTNNQDPNSAYCIAHMRPFTELATDLAQNTVARYNFIVPNLCDDMHDCGISAGDTWLSTNLPAILNSQAYKNGGAVFITWDEGANATSDGPIGMIVMSPAAKGNGHSNSIYYTHSSLLLTLQEIFGVRPLLGDAPNASDLSELFASFPAITPSTPTPSDTSSGVGLGVTLKWSSSGSNDALYFGTANPPPLVANNITTRSYTPNVSARTTYYWQVVSTSAAGTTPGPIWQFTTGTTNVPTPWANQDMGSVGIAGSSSDTNGTFTVKGAGADIWGTADAFQYAYQALTGDGQIVARVTSLQNTSTYAKAGIMFRDTLAAGSDHVILDMKPDGSVEFMQRATAGGTTAYLGGNKPAFPAWLRLARSGSTITAATSLDGVTWTTIGTASTSFPATVYVGLPVCSHATSALTTATFDNVAVTGSLPSAPASPSPANGATGVGINPTLTWSATGATTYDVAFGTLTPPPTVATGLAVGTYTPPMLANGTTYYWQVVAHNANGATPGTTWSFTTISLVPPGTPGSPNPADGATSVTTNTTLTWSATGATSYDVAFGTTNPPSLAASALTTASYAPPGMTAATTYYWQVVARNSNGTTTGPVWSFATAAAPPPPPGALPAGWSNGDVDSPGVAGSASYSAGVFTVNGAGADIWGTTDAFQYAYQMLTGDGQIVARVTSLQNTSAYAKAGIMFRDTLSANSDHVVLDIKPGGGVEFMQRATTGGTTAFLAGVQAAFPAWLRLTRGGSTITAEMSADGATWTTIGATSTALPATVFVGLPVCSHTKSALTTATFDNVVAAANPPSVPASPSPGNGATGVSTTATLTWSAAGATSYDVAFGPTNPPAVAATGLATASYAPSGVTTGTTYYWQVVAHNSNGTTTGPIWSFATATVASPPPGALPVGWSNTDIGSTGIAGSSSYSNGVFTVSGAGGDIWGSSDAFQYAYEPLSGDGQIVARVTHEDNTNAYAKAGVMLRETLTSGSRDVILDVNPNGNIEFMTRASTGGSTTWLAGATQAIPAWLKLVRSGQTVTGYVSADRVSWTTVGTTTVSMGTSAFIGLAVCSHTTSALNTSTFDSVSR